MRLTIFLILTLTVIGETNAQKVNLSLEGNRTIYRPPRTGYTTSNTSSHNGYGIALGSRLISLDNINIDARVGYKRFGGSIYHSTTTNNAFSFTKARSVLDGVFADVLIVQNQTPHKLHTGFGFSLTYLVNENISGNYGGTKFGHYGSNPFSDNEYLINRRSNIHFKGYFGYDILDLPNYVGRIYATSSFGLHEEMSFYIAVQYSFGFTVILKNDKE